jgi:hypothetical protein
MYENDRRLVRDKNGMIHVDGRGQVLDMLRAADPAFREVLLRGLERKDPGLARELRRLLRLDN